MTSSIPLQRLPLIGREDELDEIASALDVVEGGASRMIVFAGEGGVGKTRLVQAATEQAEKRGWTVALGRGYPVESGMPYAVFSDAVVPHIRKIEPATLQSLTRGGSAELALLFPALAPATARPAVRGDAAELKQRLLWNCSQFLARFATKQPLLLALENLQWADASSLELLHFVARQPDRGRVLLLCTYNAAERDSNPALRAMEQSLVSLGVAKVVTLAPLSLASVGEIVRRVFGVEHDLARAFTALLYGWTRGNPFFVEETLKSLVASGHLYERDGTWLGWDLEQLELPRTLRDAVLARMARLTAGARALADLVAVLGAVVTFDMLRALSELDDEHLLGALDELRRERVLVESGGDHASDAHYDFGHPLVRDVLYGELGKARARLLHGTVAQRLEGYRGATALAYAGELAFHFSRAEGAPLAGKALRYLTAAGRDALRVHANREAANYLNAALQQLDRLGTTAGVALHDARKLVEDLARARQRLGEYDGARALWERALAEAQGARDDAGAAAIHRRLGLADYWSGRYDDALAQYDAGLAAAARAGDDETQARLRVARAMCLQEVGHPSEAKVEVDRALAIAERTGHQGALARAHRASLLLHLFSGPPELARAHGRKAIELAAASGQKNVEWSAQWGLAILEGLTGHARQARVHQAEAERLADELRSPLLRLWSAEVAIEYATGAGDWDAALALGERSIALARALGQRTLLPRLLVWCGLLYSARGDDERARAYLDEAWTTAGAGRDHQVVDVHAVVPVHMGRAAYHLARREYAEAIAIGEAGLAIADRTGYVTWAIHRLLPIIGEAALWTQDWDRAVQHGTRVRLEAGRLGHQLGLAWADAHDAVLVFLRDKDPARAVPLLRTAAERLEAIPFVDYAARIRRVLARALIATGEREAALRELRQVHETLVSLGAERDLDSTRDLMRELGGRPPSRTSAEGTEALTGREVEIVRLVAARKSNKEIGTVLQISPRTVSTHLSNIFAKLGVGSRADLTDLVRKGGLTTAS